MAVLTAGVVVVCTLTYLYIDRRVRHRLGPQVSGLIPAIYSDSFRINSGRGIKPEMLREQLLKRHYLEQPGNVARAGEFSYKDGSLEVITREFRSADGTFNPSSRVNVAPTGHFTVLSPEQETDFELEPVIIATLGSGDVRASNYKRLEDIPESVKNAVLAIEDQRFYSHFGLDLEGIFRALIENIRARSFVQGGSTITQQLAKNTVLSPVRTLSRKFLEVFAAISLERHLTKDQILERYLNEVYLGQEGAVSIHGVDEAANSFFGKKLKDISLSEAALLAGLVKGPSYYSPRRHLKRALQRRDLVLDKMLEVGSITREQHSTARRTKVVVTREGKHRRSAPHFVAAVKRELDAELDVDAALLSGLAVYTGLNPDLQACAEQAVAQGLATLEKNYPSLKRSSQALEAGLVSIEPYSGKIRAWVGGRNFAENQFNHVSQARRQIGSTIKPFLYLTALDPNLNTYKVATTTSILADEPMQLNLETKDVWEPENYDHEYRGDVTLRYALENSLNMPAVYVAERVGIAAIATTLYRFRVAPNITEVPALALGALDTTLLDLTSAYGAIANGGIFVEARLLLSAADSDGELLLAHGIREERIADENAVYILTNILQGVIERGTGATVRSHGYQGAAAGKTGTSNETRDAWFEGFTPNLSTGVWVGYDDNSKIGLTGGRAAAPIWAAYMKCAEVFVGSDPFVAPPGVVFADIDVQSGDRAVNACPRESVIREVFVRGTEPSEPCQVHGRYDERLAQPDLLRPTPHERDRRRRGGFWERLFGL